MADMPEETEAGSYADIQGEVNKHFAGNWKQFLLAVNNPAEILHFVFANHCKKDKAAFEGWGNQQGIPADWIPRFFMTLDEDDHLKPKDKW